MRRVPVFVSVFTGLALAGGAATLIYLWIELGRRGEVADATQTAGYTTTAELVAGVFGLGLIAMGMAGLVVGAVLLGRRSDRHSR